MRMHPAMRATACCSAKGAAAIEPIHCVTGGATLLPMMRAASPRLCGSHEAAGQPWSVASSRLEKGEHWSMVPSSDGRAR